MKSCGYKRLLASKILILSLKWRHNHLLFVTQPWAGYKKLVHVLHSYVTSNIEYVVQMASKPALFSD